MRGGLIKKLDYDSFGNLLADSRPDLFVPIGFAGGLLDRDTALVRFGWRDYDPSVGRFTAPDPLGDTGGDHDLYDYCIDDPVSMCDPSGLWSKRTFDESGVRLDKKGQFLPGVDLGRHRNLAAGENGYIQLAQAGAMESGVLMMDSHAITRSDAETSVNSINHPRKPSESTITARDLTGINTMLDLVALGGPYGFDDYEKLKNLVERYKVLSEQYSLRLSITERIAVAAQEGNYPLPGNMQAADVGIISQKQGLLANLIEGRPNLFNIRDENKLTDEQRKMMKGLIGEIKVILEADGN